MKDRYLFVHATDLRNLPAIIKDGYLDPNPKCKYRKCGYDWNDEDDYKRVWFQILDVAPKNCRNSMFWGNVVMIFNENIFQSQKGEYGLGVGGIVGKNFFDSTIDKSNNWLNDFFQSIKMKLKNDKYPIGFFCGDKFIYSHEIRMKNKVPLAPSLIGILFYGLDNKQIIKFRKMLDKAGLDQCQIENFNEKATYLQIAKTFRINYDDKNK